MTGCSIYHPKPLSSSAVEGSLIPPNQKTFQIPDAQLRRKHLRSQTITLRNGVTPDEAALIAVLANPTLRADRDRHGLATAQLTQAGVLPNPQINGGPNYVIGGNTVGTTTGAGVGLSWEITQLITLLPKLASARDNIRAVDLDIAWNEWQTSQAARTSAFRIAALSAQLESSREADTVLHDNAMLLQKAVDLHDKSVLDFAAADATSSEAHSTILSIQKQLDSERLTFNRLLGFHPQAEIPVREASLPVFFAPPNYASLVSGLESSRLDLIGLKAGYESQDETLRAAILAQVPKISLGSNRGRDTTDVQSVGFGVTMDIPILDRNQGNIGTARATRQKLFNEYSDRVFQARSDIAVALSNIKLLNLQIDEKGKSVSALEKLVETAGISLKQGNADVISYYQTRYNLILKRIEYFQLKQQLAEAIVALEIASGRYLPIP